MPFIKHKAWVIQDHITGKYLHKVLDGNPVWTKILRQAIRYEDKQHAVDDITDYVLYAVPVDVSFWW